MSLRWTVSIVFGQEYILNISHGGEALQILTVERVRGSQNKKQGGN